MNGELDTFGLLQTGIEVSHGIKETQARSDGSLGIIFVSHGIAKVHEESIAKELSNMPIVSLDNVGTNPLICTHHVPILFRV